jgi:peptide/nickel transport system ATP-binding protein
MKELRAGDAQGDRVLPADIVRRAPPLRDIDVVLRVEDLVVEHRLANGQSVQAVSMVSFDVAKGETLGLVGESGCGKSSLAHGVLFLPPPTSGTIVFDSTELTALPRKEIRQHRRRLQMVFQDPISSLNPRRPVAEIIAEPLVIAKEGGDKPARTRKVAELMDAVGLGYETHGRRRAHELSGGQCQRVSIARALMLDPTLLVCDEPVSSLDVSVQAQILNLLEDMKARYGLTMIFISHDLAVVKNVSDRLAVMYLGKLCEIGRPQVLYEEPQHPYTVRLIDSIPASVRIQPRRVPERIDELPSALNPPSGCRFRTRCPNADQLCADEEPQLRATGPDHFVACHHPFRANAGAGQLTSARTIGVHRDTEESAG